MSTVCCSIHSPATNRRKLVRIKVHPVLCGFPKRPEFREGKFRPAFDPVLLYLAESDRPLPHLHRKAPPALIKKRRSLPTFHQKQDRPSFLHKPRRRSPIPVRLPQN